MTSSAKCGTCSPSGQPPSHARRRHLTGISRCSGICLSQSGVPFLEVRPRPYGCDFVCCLTHDVDFFGIRRHVFDWTLGGFLSTSVAGIPGGRHPREGGPSGRRCATGRLCSRCLSCFSACCPTSGVRWRTTNVRMARARRRSSSFRSAIGPASHRLEESSPTRAVKYQASDIAGQLAAAVARGRELAVHGIDAWRDEEAGRAEMAQVAPLGGRTSAGVRMHWLYFASDSPQPHRGRGIRLRLDVRIQRRRRIPRRHLAGLPPAGERSA